MVQPTPQHGTADEDQPEPPRLKRLRWLVTALMVVLIVGTVVVVVSLVRGLGTLDLSSTSMVPVSAEAFSLPAGAEAITLGRGPGEVLILTRDPTGAETLRVFDAATGAEKSATPIIRQ
jgi:uncharacterized protein DUF6476